MESLMEKIKEIAVNNKYVILVVLAGIALMLIPSASRETAPAAPEVSVQDPQEELEAILGGA